MLLVDTFEKSITRDEELKRTISENRPHGEWWKQHVTLEKLRKKNSVRFGINIYISFENCNAFFLLLFPSNVFITHFRINTQRKPIIRKQTEAIEENDSVLEKLWSGDRRLVFK